MNRFAWCVSTSVLMLAALGGTAGAGEPRYGRPAPYYRLPCYGPTCIVVYVPVRPVYRQYPPKPVYASMPRTVVTYKQPYNAGDYDPTPPVATGDNNYAPNDDGPPASSGSASAATTTGAASTSPAVDSGDYAQSYASQGGGNASAGQTALGSQDGGGFGGGQVAMGPQANNGSRPSTSASGRMYPFAAPNSGKGGKSALTPQTKGKSKPSVSPGGRSLRDSGSRRKPSGGPGTTRKIPRVNGKQRPDSNRSARSKIG